MTQQYEVISKAEAERRYDDYLYEVFGKVEIAGLRYATDAVLKSIDPVAYREGMLEWADMIEKVEIR